KPFQLSGVGVERQHRARIEIIAATEVVVVIGPWIAGPPEKSVGLRIVRAVIPGGHPAGLPGISSPASEVRFTGLRDRIKAPETLAGLGVVGIEKSTYTMLAASHSHDQLVLHDQGRPWRRIAAGSRVVAHFGFPDFVTRSRIHSDNVHVERVHEQ